MKLFLRPIFFLGGSPISSEASLQNLRYGGLAKVAMRGAKKDFQRSHSGDGSSIPKLNEYADRPGNGFNDVGFDVGLCMFYSPKKTDQTPWLHG